MSKSRDDPAQQRSLVLRLIYALCLIGATWNHWSAIYDHGFPRASTTFWTVLAFLDPATVILLFARPNTGVFATVAIIVSDVIHNVWVQARYYRPLLRALADAPQVAEQIAFMVFVIATCAFAWQPKRQNGGNGLMARDPEPERAGFRASAAEAPTSTLEQLASADMKRRNLTACGTKPSAGLRAPPNIAIT